MFDVAVIGGGFAGMATAARLQARGLSTIVFEAHGQPGGCAGFFRRTGFAFDVGATTLVDFQPGGVGWDLLAEIGLAPLDGELLPGYVAWLPDRRVTLYRDPSMWADERLRALGDTPAHRRFWCLLDRLATAFWGAARAGVKLPICGPADLWRALGGFRPSDWPLARYLRWTVGDALRACALRDEQPIVGLIAMLLEDTVHSQVDAAPLVNGALGITIRGAGLTRPRGGMYGFWRRFSTRYRALGGILRVGCPVTRVESTRRGGREFLLTTRRGDVRAAQVVSALPVTLTARIAPPSVQEALQPYIRRDAGAQGGALVVFLGVPDGEVAAQPLSHHQLLQDYAQPLGGGNNMFISVSAPGDTESAPLGYRAVMISTHCELADWEGLDLKQYLARKAETSSRLVGLARRVYPDLGTAAQVHQVATPRTYERFTGRPSGAVGGIRLGLGNSNQNAVPHDIGVPGFWLAGDTTWPGLGTVACVLGSRLVAEGVLCAVRHRRRNLGKYSLAPSHESTATDLTSFRASTSSSPGPGRRSAPG